MAVFVTAVPFNGQVEALEKTCIGRILSCGQRGEQQKSDAVFPGRYQQGIRTFQLRMQGNSMSRGRQSYYLESKKTKDPILSASRSEFRRSPKIDT
jgi:hypothetical protein